MHSFGTWPDAALQVIVISKPLPESAWLLIAFGFDGAEAADGEALAAEGTVEALLATRGDVLAVLASGAGVA